MAMATSKRAFSSVIKRVDTNDDYRVDDEHYPMGGTVIPAAKSDDPQHSGVRFPVHAEKLVGCNLVIDQGGEMKTIVMSPRAMEIVREGNRDGKKMNYGEAIAMAKAEEAAKASTNPDEKEEDDIPVLLQVKGAPKPAATVPLDAAVKIENTAVLPGAAASGPTPAVPVVVGVVTVKEDESPIMQAQKAAKPKKGRKSRKGEEAPQVSTPKIPVVFSSSLGQMSVMAEKVFVGGPKNICLVIIQYSPEGHFHLPPQTNDPVMVSFEGNVYKCLTGIYYQIPGTPVMHTVYFISQE